MRIAHISLLSAAAIVAASGAASAADTQTAWEGYSTNTASTAACATVGGTAKKDTHVSIYRPHIAAADTATFISMMHLRAAITFMNKSESGNPQMNGSGNYLAYGINSRGKGFSYSGTFSNFTVTPNPVMANTSVVNVTGTLNNYYNTPGCNVTFKAVYVKRID
jgi:hypothetical protein